MTTHAMNKLYLNHYKSKSKEEWEQKIKTTNNYGYMKGKWVDKPFASYDNANTSQDTQILRFVPKLKEIIKKPIRFNSKSEPYFLTVVCMFRDEDPYLKEWLDYYIMQGVSHFYLYDNENPKSTMKILGPYIANKWVTLIPWPDSVLDSVTEKEKRKNWSDYKSMSTQNLAFTHFTKNYQGKYKWVIKVDIDEFMYPSEKYKNIKKTIKKEFSKSKSIHVHRKDFGSNNHIKKPPGLVIESYIRCENYASHHKSIGNSEYIILPSCGAHSFDVK